MRVNRSRSMAKKNMRKKGLTSNRPEQIRLYEILRFWLSKHTTVLKELKYPYTADDKSKRKAILDIAVLFQGKKYAIRMMGKIHEEKKRELHDSIQQLYLEKNSWKVLNIWYDKYPNIWKPETPAKLAGEVRKIVGLISQSLLTATFLKSNTK